ncbi:MAG: ribonuclease HI [Bacteriovoracaceae bacterium]|nr:ribonuclease HI [Bacteriovoracaceae bacterium]
MKKKLYEQYIQQLRQALPGEKEQNALQVIEDAVQALPEDDVKQPHFTQDHGLADHPQALALYTDGACRHNPGPGAWAMLLMDANNKIVTEASGSEFSTTNNRMELQAVIEGLKAAQQYFTEQKNNTPEVFLFSDSQIVVNGLQSWLAGWKMRNWRKADGSPVENVTYWQELDLLAGQIKLHPTWVRGHNGHPQNEYCDQLANRALDELLHS